MTLFQLEFRRGRIALLLWTLGLSFMLGICIMIYPEMGSQMSDISTMFADMGKFSEAFGMDRLNFGEFKGYFGIECGNVLGIGGALYAALLGINALAKEEREHTAELLLTHPISRNRVYGEKLLAVAAQIVLMNLFVAMVTVGATLCIGESLPWKETALLLLSFLLLQLETAGITFGISAFLRGGSMGIGLGLALGLYFLNLISNLVDSGALLKYITPFAYADSAAIYGNGEPDILYILTGYAIALLSVLTGWVHYRKKDMS